MTAKKIDFKAVQESRARLDELAREHPELIDKRIPEAEGRQQWEAALKGILMAEKATFTLVEAAALLSCHPDTLRRAIKAGKLKAAKIIKDYRISKTDLEEYYRNMGGGALFKDAKGED
jgi:excisionase family DNA binding protein